jgi:mannose-6-phosphate isomerase-like protein (cupin superfamily)
MDKVNLLEKFGLFQEHWSPKIVGRVQDCDVRLAKVLGEFEWHRHPDEDEMFFVVKGRLLMRFRDRDVSLDEGEFLIVPRGVEHLPVANEEAWLMLVEPTGTLNTGNTVSDRTVSQLDEL